MKITYMEISTYNQGGRRADVLRTSGEDQNYWGCRYYLAGNSLGIEWYKGHSEEYAENAAENYVQGIKQYPV
jgi:hypothetical protein